MSSALLYRFQNELAKIQKLTPWFRRLSKIPMVSFITFKSDFYQFYKR
jgi:hypothetical protein